MKAFIERSHDRILRHLVARTRRLQLHARGFASIHVVSADKQSNAIKGDRVVVLGSGWGGFQLALNFAHDRNHLTVISPRNHFVFTPLLPSASVGTLECRCIQEPVRTVLGPNGDYIQAKARELDHINKKLVCESVDNCTFEIEYDKLVIAVGVKTNTFGIESVTKAAHEGDGIFFLKQLAHARAIRANILRSFEKASVPTISEAERKRLLSFVMVGGGPTSCELTAELHDFVKQDVQRLYSDLLKYVKITIVEAGPALLGPFDKALQDYAHRLFRRRDIDVRLGTAVIGVEDHVDPRYHFGPAKRALLSDGTSLEFGTMVWSAGLAPRTFTETLNPEVFPRHARTKRILVDEFMRVKGHEGSIWAIGDAAVNETGIPLPQLAQVARQQGMYLAKVFNGSLREDEKPFRFFSLGSMASVGEWKGVYDGKDFGELRDPNKPTTTKYLVPSAIKGFSALMLWRFAYWGRQTSLQNKCTWALAAIKFVGKFIALLLTCVSTVLIPMHWLKVGISVQSLVAQSP